MLPKTLVAYLIEHPDVLAKALEASAATRLKPRTFGGKDGKQKRQKTSDPNVPAAPAIIDFWSELVGDVRDVEIIDNMIDQASTDDAFFIALLHLAMVNKPTFKLLVPKLRALARRIDVVRIAARGMYLYYATPPVRLIYLSYLERVTPALHAAWVRLISEPTYDQWLRAYLPSLIASGAIRFINDMQPYNALCFIMSGHESDLTTQAELQALIDLTNSAYNDAYWAAVTLEKSAEVVAYGTDPIFANYLRIISQQVHGRTTALPLIAPTERLSPKAMQYHFMDYLDRPVAKVPHFYLYWQRALADNPTPTDFLYTYFESDNWIERHQVKHAYDATIVHLAHMGMVILDEHREQPDDSIPHLLARVVEPFINKEGVVGGEPGLPNNRSSLLWALVPLAYKHGVSSRAIRKLASVITGGILDENLNVVVELAVRYNDTEGMARYMNIASNLPPDNTGWSFDWSKAILKGLFHRKFMRHGEDTQADIFRMFSAIPWFEITFAFRQAISYCLLYLPRAAISPRLYGMLAAWQQGSLAHSLNYMETFTCQWIIHSASTVASVHAQLTDGRIFRAFLCEKKDHAFAQDVYRTLAFDASLDDWILRVDIDPSNVDLLVQERSAHWHAGHYAHVLVCSSRPLQLLARIRPTLMSAGMMDDFVLHVIRSLERSSTDWSLTLYQRVVEELLFGCLNIFDNVDLDYGSPATFEPIHAVLFTRRYDGGLPRRLQFEKPVTIAGRSPGELLRHDLAIFDEMDDVAVEAAAGVSDDDDMDISDDADSDKE